MYHRLDHMSKITLDCKLASENGRQAKLSPDYSHNMNIALRWAWTGT